MGEGAGTKAVPSRTPTPANLPSDTALPKAAYWGNLGFAVTDRR